MIDAEPPIRHPTGSARHSLASRFGLPIDPGMQDWEWEVADPERLEEFLSAYETLNLDEDERFSLMEIIIQSFEETEIEIGISPEWFRIERILRNNFRLHASSIWYWGNCEMDFEDAWRVTPVLRTLFKEQKRYGSPTSARLN